MMCPCACITWKVLLLLFQGAGDNRQRAKQAEAITMVFFPSHRFSVVLPLNTVGRNPKLVGG
jgi:hypothetical protein